MLTLFSPAKVNLFLRIVGRRQDGYHEIASLFQTICLGDTLTFSFSKTDRLACTDLELSCDHTNLVMKAVELFRHKTGLRFGINIHIEKKIPMLAGFGGGSSNAATTLWALNVLHGSTYSSEELQQWSAEIGSDVPFFFSQGTAYCTGRGEKVRNLPPPPLFHKLSWMKPKEGISTAKVFAALQLNQCCKLEPERILADFYAGAPVFCNDLEEPAFRLYPALALYKRDLLQESREVFMTGSGTAFICIQGKQKPLATINRSIDSWYS